MKNLVFLLLLLSFAGCNNQEKEKPKVEGFENEIKKDHTAVKPKEKWDVKKEYDEFGNLTKYDSIYSYSYSNIEGDSIQINLDSVMTSFRKHFQKSEPFILDNRFSYFPNNDSLFMKDFFKDDYFFDHWKRQPLDVERIIRRMDSSRNEFLKQFYPGLIHSKKIQQDSI